MGQPPEVDAAFEELALSPDTRPEDLRRAYLRVIKVRKPETDPEGFRKAREAFDLLTAWFALLSQTHDPPASTRTADEPVSPLLPLEGWDTLRPLLEARHVVEVRARIRELLEAKVAPPSIQSLLPLLLDLHRQHPGPDARATLAAFLAWVEHAQVELAFAAQPERWLLTKQLAVLPAQTPEEIERLLVLGILEGRFEEKLRGIEAFTREHPAASEALILPLAEASPLLHQLLTPVLNSELIAQRDRGVASTEAEARLADKRAGAGPGWSRTGLWAVFFVGFSLLRGLSGTDCTGALSSLDPSRPPSRYQPAVPLPPLPPPPLSTLARPGTLAPPVDGSPLSDLCARSVQDCLAAKSVQASLLEGDCLHARLEYANLINSNTLLSNSPAADALRRTMGTLSMGLELCHSP